MTRLEPRTRTRRPAARGRRLLALGALLALVATSGCVQVPPYAREDLTQPGMESATEGDEEAFRSHVYDAREGAAGGHGSTGGGCGCN